MWDQMKMLVNCDDPKIFGHLRPVVAWHDLIPKPDRAGVCGVSARQDFDQRRFAGTVLTKKRVHLSSLQFKVDCFQRRCAVERFTDFLQSKQ